uniref:ORF2 n=1 Tax=Torque teno Leptonychotes weddellii virus-1 TaxID=2012676 RepID=A0A1Z2RVD0_9VIRU|nr:ORF2 [Torque teno Leptonychotes weddellii virus 1]ASA48578.1 ORF2 [Torque teno Leptonychotes weddellii virus 1]ASA49038.1 ORF2 [Torque teno Leptonychotes weddellii virus 1]WCS65608.1 ORF2 [Torque teno Leptonychotes weddellii virus 1]
MCAAPASPGYPDLHHPLQYKRREALWKSHCRITHSEFCDCGNFLLHFKWPSTGEKGSEGTGGRDGEEEENISTGEENITADTMGEEEDIPDSALLQ